MPIKYYSRQGFTLIQLMIVVIIIGILVAISVSIYEYFALKTRRVEGQEIMLTIQKNKENYLASHVIHECTLADLGNFESDDYTFAISGASGTNYTITATAKGGQMGDAGCIFMTLNQSGLRCPGADPRCPTHADCWEK